jgi:hypothetical protein
MTVIPGRVRAIGATMLALLLGTAASAAVAEVVGSVPVRCGDVECGSMVIHRYARFDDGDALPAFERKGVSIRGRFRPGAHRIANLHFLQAFTQYRQDDVRWIRDPTVALPAAHIDPPPFGQRLSVLDRRHRFVRVDRVFDALPWYDDAGEFPIYEDVPTAFLADARKYGAVTMHFETWLVCVVDERPGRDADRVADDRYEVAALAGWRWGFDIVHKDEGRIGVDELADYTFTVLPLTFIEVPTKAFRTALASPFGGVVQDGFDITLGECERCFAATR